MPRIFDVTLTMEYQLRIVGESAEEVEAAIATQKREFIDWAPDDTGWDIMVRDPIKGVTDPKLIPTKFTEPEMGVFGGEGHNIWDYKQRYPKYMEAVHEDARKAAESLNLKALVPALPGID